MIFAVTGLQYHVVSNTDVVDECNIFNKEKVVSNIPCANKNSLSSAKIGESCNYDSIRTRTWLGRDRPVYITVLK